MATLLDGVNRLLKRVRLISGESGELSTLTNSALQTDIDTAVQVWNELIDHLYGTADERPQEIGEGTITLVTSDRSYALASDMNILLFPLIDETNGRYISEYPGGWWDLIKTQPIPANFTGQPVAAAISPVDGELYLDFLPTANENGDVFKYRYKKDLEMTAAADAFPFKDVVYRALTPAAVELWRLDQQREFNQAYFDASLGRAARYLTQTSPKDFYSPKRGQGNLTDPFHAE